MEELAVKKDFTDIYTQKHPTSYLEEMKHLKYRIPDQTKPLYKHLAELIVNHKKHSIKILFFLFSRFGFFNKKIGRV